MLTKGFIWDAIRNRKGSIGCISRLIDKRVHFQKKMAVFLCLLQVYIGHNISKYYFSICPSMPVCSGL